MAVTNNFQSSKLVLNGLAQLSGPTALDWGPDGRLYVADVTGKVVVLTVDFGDTDADGDNEFFVTEALELNGVKGFNFDDFGNPEFNKTSQGRVRQITGLDVTPRYDENGDLVIIDGKPAVNVYVTSSDPEHGADSSGTDTDLDTNSSTIHRLSQTGSLDTGEAAFETVDLVYGITRSEENHSLNGLEVVQVLDGNGKLVSERMIVASGGNTNNGAPSNNFAGQAEEPLSAAILEVDLDAINARGVTIHPVTGRPFLYELPTLDDPTRLGTADANDPFGGNDGLNSAKLTDDSPVQVYSPGYRNAYDVEVTEDGRVFTYDNGANNGWGGRPVGEAGDNNNATDFAQSPDYIATNLNNGDGNSNDDINLEKWDPKNKDQLHEITRSDDLGARMLSGGGFGTVATYRGPDGLTYVYGGHPNPTRAEGSRAGLLVSPGKGTDDAFLLVSNEDSFGNGGGSDYAEVFTWLAEVEDDASVDGIFGAGAGDLTKKVIAVTPGILYDIYAMADGSGTAVPEGGAAPAGGRFIAKSGLPSDIADIVSSVNPIEGNYLEAGKTDGALDSGGSSINGLAEYTSVLLDDPGTGQKMSGALIATQFGGGGNLIILGRNGDGTLPSTVKGGFAVATDRSVLDANGLPLGIATIGDDIGDLGLTLPFQGSIWTAVYQMKQNDPIPDIEIEIFQPEGVGVPLAAAATTDDGDTDGDGVDAVNDPFALSADNGYAITAGQTITLDFDANSNGFSGSLGGIGFLGAALDGVTPNQDAQTEAELFPDSLQRDGLFDDGGNIIPGANAPVVQIKTVVPGTMVGSANTARDALQTGILPDNTVNSLAITLTAANWIPALSEGLAEGQVSGLVFSDGTQENFLRVVFGGVDGGGTGIEVGYEIDDVNYTVLGSVALPGLNTGAVSELDLRLDIGEIGEAYAVTASYRLEGQAVFTEVPLNGGTGFSLPPGVLRDVLAGAHTISDENGPVLPSGAAIGIVAETPPGEALTAVDFYNLDIEAFATDSPSLPKGDLVLGVNVGPVSNTTANLAGPDNNTYGGAITNDPLLNIDLEADRPDYYTPSSKTGYNIDGILGPTGSNPALDGSALHTYRDSADKSFTADYPIADGTYVVQLWMTELYHDTAGKRQGDYIVEGVTFAENFDAFAVAGGADIPVMVEKIVTVTDGSITIDIEADKGEPGLSAVVVYDADTGSGGPGDPGTPGEPSNGGSPGTITFTPSALSDWSDQNEDDSVAISPSGATMTLTGNTWKKLAFDKPYTVQPGDEITLTFQSTEVGEIMGVGLEKDDVHTQSGQPMFQLAGSQNWAVFDRRAFGYSPTEGEKTVTIDLSEFVGETYTHLGLVNDADADTAQLTNVTFSQVVIGDDAVAPPASSDLDITFTPENLLDWANQNLDDRVSIQDAGRTLELTGNTWKRLALDSPYTVKEGDELIVTFGADSVGEILGIGLEDDNIHTQSGQPLFQLAGSQSWDVFDRSYFGYSLGEGEKTVAIDLSAFAGRAFSYLGFVNDADKNGAETNAVFSSVSIRSEDTSSPPPSGDDDIAFTLAGLSDWSNQNKDDGFVILDGGYGLELTGNTWKRFDLEAPFTVQQGDSLTVTFSSTQTGEIIGIGLEDDNEHAQQGQPMFQLAGSQNWNVFDRSYFGYTAGDGEKTVTIDLSAYEGQAYRYLGLVNDADKDGSFANVVFSDVRLNRADGTLPPPDAPREDIMLSFSLDALADWSDQNGDDGVSIIDGGAGVALSGNTWKRLELDDPYTVEAGDILMLTFSSTDVGEILGVGLEDDNIHDQSGRPMFQLAGSQNWNVFDRSYFGYTVGEDEKTVAIDLSAFADQTFSHLGLVNDADGGGASGSNATFSDISIVRGEPAAPAADPLPASPTALSTLSGLSGIDTDGVYSADAIGSATLHVLETNDTVTASNFGNNSFTLKNTGLKDIAAVFIDFRDALYPDSVVDLDGSAGDTVVKPFGIQSGADSTGVIVTSVGNQSNGLPVATSYLLPGSDPLDNNTGTGVDESGGYRGLLLQFDGSDGGFSGGEQIGFSGDMDPNSIAGLVKKAGSVGVDVNAIGNWDVGGISGAEIIGSAFTVLFDDGSTATGVLGDNGLQAAGVGRASQSADGSSVAVTVNGSSGVGSYGGAVPQIVVTGTSGEEVRVVLSRGINPVTNDRNDYGDLVAARLTDDHPDFPVNNAADFQFVDVVLDADGQVTLENDAFDWSGPKGGLDFEGSLYTPGFDTAPAVVAAYVVDEDGFAVSEADRTYLQNDGQPIAPGPSGVGFGFGFVPGTLWEASDVLPHEDWDDAGVDEALPLAISDDFA